MPKLAVAIITRDEAANISAALESVAWADEIVVVDAESTDETVSLARRHTNKVLSRPWDGYANQKNFAASYASFDWILSLDADERVTPELAAEIRGLLAVDPPCSGYRVPRLTRYLGRWIRSTDWYPDWQLRLYDRRAGGWATRHVHESVHVQGRIGYLQHPLHHLAYDDVFDHLEAINRYTTLAARQMREDGRRGTFAALIAYPPLAFLRNYIIRGGFRDGAAGLIISLLNSYYTLLKFVKLWEMEHVQDKEQRHSPREGAGSRLQAPGSSSETSRDWPEPEVRSPKPDEIQPMGPGLRSSVGPRTRN